MNQRTTENMLQQSSFDSKMKEEQERTELFSNQLQIKDRIERMNKEIQNLGENMLEISSLLTDETKNNTGFTFYNDSIKSMTDEDEEEDEINNHHIKDKERMDKDIQTEEGNDTSGFNFYNDSIKSLTDDEDDYDYDEEDDDNDMNVIPFKRFSRDDQSLII